MTVPSNPAADGLPPRPDPDTGLPRPPRAPRNFAANDPTPTDRSPRRAPPPPEGRGILLEWRQETPKSAFWAGGVLAVLMAGLPTVNSGSFGWMIHWWWYWFLVLFAFWIGYGIFSNMWIAAGATWLQNGKRWVDLYRLTDVNIKAAGANHMLRLKDGVGREVSVKLDAVQRNQDLWDLVYNGILHAVVTGQANPPGGSRTILKLPTR